LTEEPLSDQRSVAWAGASPAERYAVATRPTLIPGIGRQKVFELAAADPAIASRARKDPALAEARKDPRVRVTLGIDSLLAPATVRRVLAAAGPIGGRECGDLRDEPSMHFQEDGRVRTSEPCADQGMVDGDGPAVLCDVEGTYVASRGAVVISLPGRNPMGPLAVEVSGYAVSVGGLTNEAPPCGERIP